MNMQDTPQTNDHMIMVAPLFNEEELVDQFLDRIAGSAEQIRLKGVVLVDDGSTDQTVTRIYNRAPDFPVPIRLIRLSRNFGQQNGCLAGLSTASKWAEELGIEWIGLIDADLQDEPEHFANLKAQSQNYDVVYAVRAKRNDGIIMKVMAPLFYRFMSATSHFPIPRNAGTFSIMRQEVVKFIVASADTDPYLPGLRSSVGFRQTGVPLERSKRAAGKSKVRLFGLFMLSLRAALMYSDFVFNCILYTGIAVFSISLLVTFVLSILRLLGLITVPGATAIIDFTLMSLGVQLVILGLMAHMINRIKANTSKQQAWIIMKDEILK